MLEASGVAYSELDVLTDEMIAQRRAERVAAIAVTDADPATVMEPGGTARRGTAWRTRILD